MISSSIAGLGGALIGACCGQLSVDSFTVMVGLSLLAFAYLGGITSIGGAITAGLLAPLGVIYVLADRLIDAGEYYLLLSGVGLVLTALFNPAGIAGKTRDDLARLRGWRRSLRRVETIGGVAAHVDGAVSRVG